jgi:hypothetical protein
MIVDFSESKRQTAEHLVRHGVAQGCDVSTFCNEYNVFVNGKRWVEFWQSDQAIGYHLAGEVRDLPSQLAASRSSFRGVWDEAGTLEGLGHAFELLRSWLIDGKEVDDLPTRSIHRSTM